MKSNMSKLISLVVVLALFASLLSGCGNSNSGTSTDAADSATNSSDEVSENSDGSIKTGGVLRTGTSLTPSQLGYTPEVSANSSIPFLRTAYNTLLWYDEDGNLVSDLATEWEVDSDSLTITFKLREGVTFHDGTPFNSEAVKWNVEEYQNALRSEVSSVASMDTPDDYTIIMNLSEWNSSALLSIGTTVYFMSPTAYEEAGGTPDAIYHNAVGTGPFILSEFNQTVSVIYEANPNYFIDGQPYLDGVEFLLFADETTMMNAFAAGEVDIINNVTDLINRSTLQANESVIEAQNSSGIGLESVGVIPASSSSDSPFADERVRQAMNYAIDVETLLATIGKGQLQGLNQWASTDSATWSPNVEGQPYDPDKARELLAEAGYPDGFDTVFNTVGTAGIFNDLALAIADMLSEVGIRAEINLIDGTMSNSMMTNGWDGLMWHRASISPDLGLWMGRHLDANGAFYAPGIQHPQDALDLLESVRLATTDEDKITYSWELQELLYDEYALFGCPLFVNAPTTYAYNYVQDHNWRVSHALAWSPGTAWLDK